MERWEKLAKQRFPNWKKPEMLHCIPNKYGWTVLYPENFELGEYTDIGYGVLINAQYKITIGRYTQIGPYTCILSSNTINDVNGEITIGEGVRIGAYSLILPNVTIENGEFIKAYSVVR